MILTQLSKTISVQHKKCSIFKNYILAHYFQNVSMRLLWVVVLVTHSLTTLVHTAKILGVFPVPSISHQKSFLNIGKELSLKGHHVTFIVTNPMKDTSLTNFTEIDVSHVYTHLKQTSFAETMNRQNSMMDIVFGSRALFEEISEIVLNSPEVKDLINSDVHFDLVLVEPHAAVFFAFGAKFKAPIIGKL